MERKRKETVLPAPPAPVSPPFLLLMGFWALMGAASGITIAQSIWKFIGFDVGDVSIAVPVGGVIGAVVGALIGLIQAPRFQVLLIAVFAGVSAGAVAGRVPWGVVGEAVGQIIGGLLGAVAWSAWLFFGRRDGTE